MPVKHIIRFVFFSGFLLIISGCYSSRLAELTERSRKQKIDFLITQGNAQWDQRKQVNSAQRARHFYENAWNLMAGDPDIAVKVSRSCFFEGYYFTKNPTTRDSIFQRGIQASRSTLTKLDTFQILFQSTTGDSSLKLIRTLESMPESTTGLMYWWAANLVHSVINQPIGNRFNSRELIETLLNRVVTIDPLYDYGGSYRLLGMFYSRLPGVELDRALSYFDRAESAYPDYFSTSVLKAKFYHTKAGNREQFHRELTEILDADPTILPGAMPENLLNQEMAQNLLNEESSLFE